jgi:thioredoxin 1
MRTKVILSMLMIAIIGINKVNAQQDVQGSANGIEFYNGSWEEAMALAKKEGKLIFLDVYASWCGPCKMLKKNTFTDPGAGKYFNKNFINIALDSEKGDGIKVARSLKVRAYPSMYILNSDGSLVEHHAGYLQPEGLLKFGRRGQAKFSKLAVLK